MSLKASFKEIANYHDIQTPGMWVGYPCLFTTIAGLVGAAGGALSTNFHLNAAENGDPVAREYIAEYTKKFSLLAETEKKVVKLQAVADSLEMEAALGEGGEAVQRKFAKAKDLIVVEKERLSTGINNLSRSMVVDAAIPENHFDDMVLAFDNALKTPLPDFLQRANEVSGGKVTAYDSFLRECQIAYADADGHAPLDKAEKIVDCTEKNIRTHVAIGSQTGAALGLAWFFGAPLLRRRKEERAAAAKAEESKLATLKITYK